MRAIIGLRSLVAVAAVATASSALCACGSGPVAASSARATASVRSGGAQASAAPPQVRGSHGLVTLSNFPPGWTAQGRVSTRDGTSAGLSGSLAPLLGSCLGARTTAMNARNPHWSSPTFSDNSSATVVNDAVTVFPNTRSARRAYATFANPKTPACLVRLLGSPLKQEVSQRLQPGQTVGQVVSNVRPISTYGQSSGDIELVVPITESGRQLAIFLDVIVVLQGRAESTLTASSPNSPFPAGLVARLGPATATNMAQLHT